MKQFATIDDVIKLFRPLNTDEMIKANELLSVISDSLRLEARKNGKDLDKMAEDEIFSNVLKSVVVDVLGRNLMTSTNGEPMTQESQSAMGYSWSGTYLVPGGGLFIKRSELQRLGLRNQKIGTLDVYGVEKWEE